ncbi:MAG: DUF3574 domain-containing protein [Planctomycetes bacterium]|nr:DUF3574 domain-containing protein [Planctomycetota bacterium]
MYKFEILTEDKNRDKIIAEVSKFFDGFSITEQIGYWKGEQEKSLNIMIVGRYSDSRKIDRIASAIQNFNDQESVMTLVSEIHES